MKKKPITRKHFKTLNAKANQIGLNTHELLQVLERMINADMDRDWKNKHD